MIETFTRSDVFSFSCRLTFFQKLKVSHGIKILPVT